MNPNILFDKSIFQESPASSFLIVDRYLEMCIPPILVREIGGDLAASSGKRKEKDQSVFVEKLAHRPGVRAFLVHHGLLIQRDLLGYPIAMDGRTPVMADYLRTADGVAGLHTIESPEEYALNRWRQGRFTELDYLWAEGWQRVQKRTRVKFYVSALSKHGIYLGKIRSLEELVQEIEALLSNPAAQPALLRIIFTDFIVPITTQELVVKRFQSKNPRLLINDFAPYAAFCLKANLLLGFGSDLLTRGDRHDLRDLEYCYYLPFCDVFASSDNLHRMLSPLLMRKNQMLVGSELIDDLRRLVADWMAFTPEEKSEFVRVNGNIPPQREGSVLRNIWERYRGPGSPPLAQSNPSPDSFFRKLVTKSYGSDRILEDTDVENIDVFVQRIQMTKARATELYPGFDFDNRG